MDNFTINLAMFSFVPTGLGVYAEHCARFLERRLRCTVISSCYKPEAGTTHVSSPECIGIGRGRFAAYLRFLYLFLLRRGANELVYTPTHHGLFRHEKQVLTICDFIPIRHPSQHIFQYLYFRWLFPYMVGNAKAIFTLSNAVKREICSYYNISGDKVFVVPCGVDTEKFRPTSPDTKPFGQDYLLVAGASYPHKNVVELLENWRYWKGLYKVRVVSSGGSYKRHLLSVVNRLNLADDVSFLGCVSDDELVILLQNCCALVFPSLSEGFGMPPLEAMACGRPAIVSDIEVHKELMKDVPFYVTPGKSETWQQAFLRLQDESIVSMKIAQGLELVRTYSWERSGEILLDSLLRIEPGLLAVLKNCHRI